MLLPVLGVSLRSSTAARDENGAKEMAVQGKFKIHILLLIINQTLPGCVKMCFYGYHHHCNRYSCSCYGS